MWTIFYLFQEQAAGSEAIGQIYQDEKNMAAILMRRQLETGDLMMVSRREQENDNRNLQLVLPKSIDNTTSASSFWANLLMVCLNKKRVIYGLFSLI